MTDSTTTARTEVQIGRGDGTHYCAQLFAGVDNEANWESVFTLQNFYDSRDDAFIEGAKVSLTAQGEVRHITAKSLMTGEYTQISQLITKAQKLITDGKVSPTNKLTLDDDQLKHLTRQANKVLTITLKPGQLFSRLTPGQIADLKFEGQTNLTFNTYEHETGCHGWTRLHLDADAQGNTPDPDKLEKPNPFKEQTAFTEAGRKFEAEQG